MMHLIIALIHCYINLIIILIETTRTGPRRRPQRLLALVVARGLVTFFYQKSMKFGVSMMNFGFIMTVSMETAGARAARIVRIVRLCRVLR